MVKKYINKIFDKKFIYSSKLPYATSILIIKKPEVEL